MRDSQLLPQALDVVGWEDITPSLGLRHPSNFQTSVQKPFLVLRPGYNLLISTHHSLMYLSNSSHIIMIWSVYEQPLCVLLFVIEGR